jgi:hypothetical protein
LNGVSQWQFAALRLVGIGDQWLALSLLSNTNYDTVFNVQTVDGGGHLGGWTHPSDWCCSSPESHLKIVDASGATFSVVQGRRDDYFVDRLTDAGPHDVGRFDSPRGAADIWAPGVVDDHPVVFTAAGQQVRCQDLRTGEIVGPPWMGPAGWEVAELVHAGGRTYAWLVPAAQHGELASIAAGLRMTPWHGWLFDVVARIPVRAPMSLRGWLRDAWLTSSRPAVLVALDPSRSQVWDLALGGPLGPALPITSSDRAMSLGFLHGRPVLAVADVKQAVRVVDVATATALCVVELPRPPLATAVGAGGRLSAVLDDGTVTTTVVPLRAVHPLARPAG